MSYTLLLERAAEKELRTLPAQILRRIDKRLLALHDEPRPRGVVKLKGKEKVIRVYRIKHRREAYR